jgi:hypothetical protein
VSRSRAAGSSRWPCCTALHLEATSMAATMRGESAAALRAQGVSVISFRLGASVLVALFCLVGACSRSEDSVPGDVVWEECYGGGQSDFCHDLRQTADGGYILVGSTSSFGAGSLDVYLVRTDDDGDTLWTRTYGGLADDVAYAVRQTADGGFVIVGYTESVEGGRPAQAFLLRTDRIGDTVWTRCYGLTGDDKFRSVVECAEGFAAAGYVHTPGRTGADFWLVRLSRDGDTLWTRTYGVDRLDEKALALERTADNGFILAGSVEIGGSDHAAFVVRTDGSGDTVWTRTYDAGVGWDETRCVSIAADGGFVLAGYTESVGAGEADMWLLRLDQLGDTIWTRTFGGTEYDYGYSAMEAEGGFVCVGNTYSYGAGQNDFYLVATDSAGDTLWTRTYGGGGYETATGLCHSPDADFVLGGWTESYGQNPGRANMYLVKVSAD